MDRRTLQSVLENAIHKLVDEFLQEPYKFFTEADAVARFHQMLDEDPILSRRVQTEDGHEVSLIHREYPTFFRFSDKEPTARLGPPARRGHYDTVILNPEFVTTHPAATVTNRDIKTVDESVMAFEAVVEFKLYNEGWSVGRKKGVIAELGKLNLSMDNTPLCYLVILMRYYAPNLNRWDKYWPTVSQSAKETSQIGSIFAIQWLTIKHSPEVHHFGRWLSKQ
jgi:hypothetical protein